MYGTKGSSDSDTAIWDDADRESEPSGKTLGSRSVSAFWISCSSKGQHLTYMKIGELFELSYFKKFPDNDMQMLLKSNFIVKKRMQRCPK